jgi:type I restriction enzyme, S subunit
MSTFWKEVRLGEVLRHVARPTDVIPDQMYREIGIRSHGKGLFHKRPVAGHELGNKRVFWLEPGDFVLNIVFAWEGAVGRVSEAERGMIGSHRFPTFRCDEAHLDLDFLVTYFKTPKGLELLARVSPGGAGRNRTLSKGAFLEQTISLPPVVEQRRIVANFEALAIQIAEVRTLRYESAQEADVLLLAGLRKLTERLEPKGKLGDALLAPPRNGWSARCDNAEDGLPVLSLGAVTGFRYRGSQFKRTSLHAREDGHFWLKQGDLLVTRSNTPDLVGHAAIYDGRPSPCIYPDLMMRLDLKEKAYDRRFVWYWLQSPCARDFIREKAKGTSPTMKKISQGVVMDIPFPSALELSEQRRIVAELDTVQMEVDALKRLQTETAAELDAMLPAILDRAFKGEL